jgi:hypothetical protein
VHSDDIGDPLSVILKFSCELLFSSADGSADRELSVLLKDIVNAVKVCCIYQGIHHVSAEEESQRLV